MLMTRAVVEPVSFFDQCETLDSGKPETIEVITVLPLTNTHVLIRAPGRRIFSFGIVSLSKPGSFMSREHICRSKQIEFVW